LQEEKASTLERIVQIIVRVAEIDPATPIEAGTTLTRSGLELDSVALVETLLEVEKEFGIELEAHVVLEEGGLETAGALADLVASRTGPAQGGS